MTLSLSRLPRESTKATIRREYLSLRLVVVCLILSHGANAQSIANTAVTRVTAAPVLVIGFVGGFVHADDIRHSEVQLVQELQAAYGSNVRVEIFENRQIDEARSFILHTLDVTGHGTVSENDKAHARIILFGHSWGASAVVYLARDLQRDGIPVSLTVQVDSVRKHGEDDSVIPSNVKAAVNFYQTGGILHGRREISASDPSKTTILGNFRFQYAKQPAECRSYPWQDRLLFKGHTSIECDPRVWSQVDNLIRMQLRPAETQLAALPYGLLPRKRDNELGPLVHDANYSSNWQRR